METIQVMLGYVAIGMLIYFGIGLVFSLYHFDKAKESAFGPLKGEKPQFRDYQMLIHFIVFGAIRWLPIMGSVHLMSWRNSFRVKVKKKDPVIEKFSLFQAGNVCVEARTGGVVEGAMVVKTLQEGIQMAIQTHRAVHENNLVDEGTIRISRITETKKGLKGIVEYSTYEMGQALEKECIPRANVLEFPVTNGFDEVEKYARFIEEREMTYRKELYHLYN